MSVAGPAKLWKTLKNPSNSLTYSLKNTVFMQCVSHSVGAVSQQALLSKQGKAWLWMFNKYLFLMNSS